MTYRVPVSHGLAEGYNVRNNILTLEFKGPPFGSYTSKPNLYLVSYAYSSSGPYMFVDFSYNEFITCLHKFCITNLRFFSRIFYCFLVIYHTRVIINSLISIKTFYHSKVLKNIVKKIRRFVVKEFVKTCDELVLR